jgi:hypothetical protein
MLRSFPNPESGTDVFPFEHGIDVANDNLKMAQNLAKYGWTHARKLDNWDYDQDTLRRRKAFTAKSTVDWSAEGDYGNGLETPGIFQGGHVFTDIDGTSRLLHAHDNGTIKEFVSAGSSVNRVSGLTAGQRVRFEDFNGACFAVNGADQPRRADGDTWRTAGAPAALAAPTTGALSAGSVEAGRYLYMVTACIREDGVVVLESDHSGYLTVTYASNAQQVINWAASLDGRVNWYRLYRVTRGTGSPFFLLHEANVLTYSDNTPDADLSETTAAGLGRNGVMPVCSLIAKSGKRLAIVDENGKICVSIIATNDFEMEYFPDDDTHRFKLPGRAAPTACFPIGNKDEEDNANDLFLAQATSCYILRETDPYGTLEPISREVGCRNPDAVAQWGRYLFFMSHRGLEFLGPSGSPVMVSGFVNPYFKGGGPMGLLGISGERFLSLTTSENKLLIAFRDDSSKRGAHKTLVLDLEAFNPHEPLNPRTTRFCGPWDGPGMAFYIEGETSELYLCDNENHRLLQRATGVYDSIAGVDTVIRDKWKTGPLNGGLLTYRKRFRSVNVFQVTDSDTTISFEVDYGRKKDTNRTLPMNAEGKVWDKPWNKAWAGSPKWKGCLGLPPSLCGSTLSIENLGANTSIDRIHIGINFNFTMIKQRTVCAR